MGTTVLMRRPGKEMVEAVGERKKFNLDIAQRQHTAYADAIRAVNADVRMLDALEGCPNGVFPQDVLAVSPNHDFVVFSTPGRKGGNREAERLQTWFLDTFPRYVNRVIRAKNKLDCGDLIFEGHTVFLSAGTRTDRDVAVQLREELPDPYKVTILDNRAPDECLHLRGGCSYIGEHPQSKEETFLVNSRYVDPAPLKEMGYRVLEVLQERRDEEPPEKNFGANTQLVNGTLFCSKRYTRTNEMLRRHGFSVQEVSIDQVENAGGGPSCATVVFEDVS